MSYLPFGTDQVLELDSGDLRQYDQERYTQEIAEMRVPPETETYYTLTVP
jgi:hypothetical protein